MVEQLNSPKAKRRAGANLIEDLIEKIGEIEVKAIPLRERRDALNDKARELAEKRNYLNIQAKKLMDEAAQIQTRRDELNKQVHELKLKREMIKQQLQKKRGGTKTKISRRGHSTAVERSLSREIRNLEWKIQTSSLTLEEEKRVMKQIKTLESRLIPLQSSRINKATEAQDDEELKELRKKMNEYHNAMCSYAQESQHCHTRMNELIKQAKQTRAEANETHRLFVETKKNADEAHKEYIQHIMQIKQIEKQIRQFNENMKLDQIRKAVQSRENLGKLAEKKLKQKEKLTFDEFKVLVEKGAL